MLSSGRRQICEVGGEMMKIETRFSVGNKVWFAYRKNKLFSPRNGTIEKIEISISDYEYIDISYIIDETYQDNIKERFVCSNLQECEMLCDQLNAKVK